MIKNINCDSIKKKNNTLARELVLNSCDSVQLVQVSHSTFTIDSVLRRKKLLIQLL